MDCKKIKKILYDYTKGELSLKYKILIEKHIKTCDECKSELNNIIKIKKIFTNSIVNPPVGIFYNLKMKISGALNLPYIIQRFKLIFATSIFLFFLIIGIFLYNFYIYKTQYNLMDFIYNSYNFIDFEEDTNSDNSFLYTDYYM